MKNIFFYMLQVTIASGILYCYYHLALRNKKFHQYNRFYLLAAFVISIVIPFFNIHVYFTHTETDSSFILQTLTSISASGSEEPVVPVTYSPIIKTNWITWQNVLYTFYITVATIILIRILFSLRKIRLIIRNNPVEKLENIHFVNTDEAGTPFSFFRWLFWNRQIELRSEKGEQIFRHELFHIQQRHSRDIIFMELMMVVFWINPFFHLIKKEVKAIHEFLADKFAANENNKWEYAELLLMQALGAKQYLVNPFFHNQIKRRIAMITTSKNPGYLYMRKLMVLPIAAIVVALFAFSYKNKEAGHKIILSEKTITVVIDAAHGGTDQGALSVDKKYSEAQLTLEIAQQIQKLGKIYNVNVLMTRESNQFPAEGINQKDGLWSRVAITKKANPDAFISIHINTAANTSNSDQANYSGFEAYVSGKREDTEGKLLASAILKGLAPIYKTSVELKQNKENGIYVLDHNSYPAVLLECGYINNSQDLAFITNKDNQEKIARSILEALVNYKNSEAKLNELNLTEKLDTIIAKKLLPDTILWIKDATPPAKRSHTAKYISLNDTVKPLISSIEKVLLIIDGTVRDDINKSNIDLAVNVNNIESINVLKGVSAIAKYGKKGKDGVIEIFTKKKIDNPTLQDQKPSDTTKPTASDNRVFERVDIEASFPGGSWAWEDYLQKNVNTNLLSDNKAPANSYAVLVHFKVEKTGYISDVRAVTDNGFGMENEAVRVVKKSQRWLPALLKDKIVTSYKTVFVRFSVPAEKREAASKL